MVSDRTIRARISNESVTYHALAKTSLGDDQIVAGSGTAGSPNSTPAVAQSPFTDPVTAIMNAAEAMASIPPSERALGIASRDADKGYVTVSIRDHGPGMSPDELKRIHEPFFTTREGGLGLGLSICSTIIRSHRGRLNLANASSGGMTATVSVPAAIQLVAAS